MLHALRLLTALWFGGTTVVAFGVVPFLFISLGNPAVAGPVAAQLFTAIAFASWAAALVGLLMSRRTLCVRPLLGWLLLAALCAVVQEWVVAEQILNARVLGADVKPWHRAGTVLVGLQWLVALRVYWFGHHRRAQP